MTRASRWRCGCLPLQPQRSDDRADQIRIVKEQFGVEELVFVGDRGMVKSKGKQALGEAGLRYITALTDPQIRRRLSEGVLQLELFAEQVCEVEADGVRYVLRLNESEAKRQRQRLEDKLAKLGGKLDRRNQKVTASSRCEPAAGLRQLKPWLARHKLTELVVVALAGTSAGRSSASRRRSSRLDLELAGAQFIEGGVPMSPPSA